MLLNDAQKTVEDFLYPVTLDEFLDGMVAGGFRKIEGRSRTGHVDLLGPEPQQLLSEAPQLAPGVTFHSANPLGPPPGFSGVTGVDDFKARIGQLHARNFSVRFANLRPLSEPVDLLARALEVLFHQPVTASAFWSRAGIKAPVHFDEHDLIVVQLRGAKRWRISTAPPTWANTWVGAETPPAMGPHQTVDVVPGDVLYLPRGTFHDVESDAESLHLALGFTPLTAREAIIAALDYLSDRDPELRQTVGQRLAFQVYRSDFSAFDSTVRGGLDKLMAACAAPGFVANAIQRRSSRAIAALPAPPASPTSAITLDTVLIQAPAATCHMIATPEHIMLSYPGGRIAIHRGARESLLFMVNSQEFRVRDVPGNLGDDVRLSLAAKLLEIGLLRATPPTASARSSSSA